MALNQSVRPLCMLFGFLGLIQSIAWITLAILSLLTYADQLDWNLMVYGPADTSNACYIRQFIKLLYFTKTQDLPPGFPSLLVNKCVILGFSILYLSVSVVWALISSALFHYSKFSKWPMVKMILILFVIWVGVISVADITLMTMLICDYSTMETNLHPFLPELLHSYVLLVIGIMMTLAGRGFLLLLLNLTSIIYCLCLICSYEDNASVPDVGRLYRVPIEAYREYPGDPNFAEAYNKSNLRSQWHSGDGYPNDSFESEPPTPQPTSPYKQANFFERMPPAGVNKPPASKWPIDNIKSDKTIISRNGIHNDYAKPNRILNPPKPIKVHPPVPPPKPSKKGPPVPFPDYTPPQSPKYLRPVIKQNSSYY